METRGHACTMLSTGIKVSNTQNKIITIYPLDSNSSGTKMQLSKLYATIQSTLEIGGHDTRFKNRQHTLPVQ